MFEISRREGKYSFTIISFWSSEIIGLERQNVGIRDLPRFCLAVSLPQCTSWSKNWTNTFILRYLDTVRLRAQVKKDEAWACVGLVWPFLRHYAHVGRARGRRVCVCSMLSMVPTTSLESFGRVSQTYVVALSIYGYCFQN